MLGDPDRIVQIINNLVSNAVKFTRKGDTIRVQLGSTVSGDGIHYLLQVEDTGIGIAREEQAKIFERFYRVDKSRSKARGGTGLGLAIVKHAAAFHGATISLDSEPDCGTRIVVTFPVQVLPSVAVPMDAC